MNGLTILSHSLRQITGNLGMALRISGGFWVMLLGAFVLYLVITALTGSGLLAIVLGIGLLVLVVWGVSLIAVVWHRYILLEERPKGFLPTREGLNVWPYFWYGVGIALIVLAVLLVLFFIASFFIDADRILAAFDQNSLSLAPGDITLRFVVGLLSSVISLRLALILPAVALDERLRLGDSWNETKGYTFAIIVISVLLTVLNAGVSLVFGMVILSIQSAPVAVLIVSLVMILFQWFYFMLNISILSTLYGHIVQKREVY